MCIGRENRNKETQIPQKKNKGSCKLKCQRWILSKFERCLKKKIFGYVIPKLADYEIMGMDLESLQDNVTGKTSDKSLNKKVTAANKIKLAKVDMKDIEKIKGISANDLKKRYSIKGSKLKILEGMVTDYNDGNISFSQKSRKPSSTKQLTKEQLNEILKDYDTAKKKTVADEIQKNAKDLKKIVKTQSQRQLLDNVLEDLKKGKFSNVDLLKNKLDLKNLDNKDINNFLSQYGGASKQKRGLSSIIRKSKFSMIPSKLRMQQLLAK